MSSLEAVETVGKVVDARGMAIIVVGVTGPDSPRYWLVRCEPNTYDTYGRRRGRSNLLVLEFLNFFLELESTGCWPWAEAPDSLVRNG